MAEKKHPAVTLEKNGRKVTTSLPREIVQYKAAGWREEEAGDAAAKPKAEPKAAEDPSAAKGGTKK